jgi:HK97 family phage prohead protease
MSEAAAAVIAESVDEEFVEGEVVSIPPGERPMLGRMYETVEIAADGRNVELLCAPFDRPAVVNDGNGPYREEFARGAFAGVAKAPHRVYLEFEHFAPGLSGIIGHGSHFEERSDALYGRFRMGRQPDGDKALELIQEGVLTAASVFFEPHLHIPLARDHVRRTKVTLDRVALCRVGSYPEARVLKVRSAPIPEAIAVEIPETARVLPFDADLRARIEAAGLAVPPTLR